MARCCFSCIQVSYQRDQFRYTLDGSDPRYSASAVVYSGAVTLTSGQTINVAGFATANDKCVSDVVSATYTA